MPPIFRTCLPLAIALALGLSSIPAQARSQTAATPVQAAPAPQPPTPKHGPTPRPIGCAKRLTGVDAGQAESFTFWLRKQGPAEEVKVEFSCKLDRHRLIVGLLGASADRDKGGPPKHTVHMLDLAVDPPPSRLLHSNKLDEPAVIVRPGGGMSLVFGETTIERGLTYRGYRAIDLASGKVQTFLSLPTQQTGQGCAAGRAMGLERISVSSEAALVDLGDNGPYGFAIEHESIDCRTGKSERRLDTFIAVPAGFEEFK